MGESLSRPLSKLMVRGILGQPGVRTGRRGDGPTPVETVQVAHASHPQLPAARLGSLAKLPQFLRPKDPLPQFVGVRPIELGRRGRPEAIGAGCGRFSGCVNGMIVKRFARLFAAIGLVAVTAYAASDPASPVGGRHS